MPDYVLGHTPAELKRLRRQHRLIGGFTRQLFVEAGIASCRRVLDVGCGAGDVALLAAELVGPGGSVIGVDRETACLGLGRERASAAGFSRVTFQAGDPAKLALEAPFDAVVGRYVLLFQADQAGLLGLWRRCCAPAGCWCCTNSISRDWRPIRRCRSTTSAATGRSRHSPGRARRW